jgi:hypothetical protein
VPTKSVVTVLAFYFGAAGQVLAEDRCAEMEGAKPEVQLEYLRRERSTLNPTCISQALYGLSLRVNPNSPEDLGEVIGTILKYLDYRLSEQEASKYIRAVSSNLDPYPASSALIIIGRPVLPTLVETIARPETSEIARNNAIWIMLMICSRQDLPEAVRLLKRAGRGVEDPEASRRLLEAARKASELCKGRMANACRDAFYEP